MTELEKFREQLKEDAEFWRVELVMAKKKERIAKAVYWVLFAIMMMCLPCVSVWIYFHPNPSSTGLLLARLFAFCPLGFLTGTLIGSMLFRHRRYK